MSFVAPPLVFVEAHHFWRGPPPHTNLTAVFWFGVPVLVSKAEASWLWRCSGLDLAMCAHGAGAGSWRKHALEHFVF